MKHPIIVLSAAACVFLLGCDQSVNNPVAMDDTVLRHEIAKPAPDVDPGPSLLKFARKVEYIDGKGDAQVMQAFGEIGFRINLVPTVPIYEYDFYDVEISTKGEIRVTEGTDDAAADVNPLTWSFSGSSTTRISIHAGTKVGLVQSYEVQGMDDLTFLNIEFTATEKALVINTMYLTHEEKESVSHSK